MRSFAGADSSTAAVRHPGPSIDQGIVDDLEETLSLLDIRQRFDTRRAQ